MLFERLALPPDVHLKLAFSGGLDSLALLHALACLRADPADRGARRPRMDLSAVHVDHGLQPASSHWARRCQQVCTDLAVPCRIERIKVTRAPGASLEAAARQARYEALARHIGANDVLLTAHHQDDQAETLLLQLLRGAGVHGLAAMPPITDFGRGRLARPLLEFPRSALRDYALAQRLDWIEDASNHDLRHRRNLIRHALLPQLAQHWPQAAALLARSARHASQAAVLLDEIAHIDLGACRLNGPRATAVLSIPALRTLSPERLGNALRYWLRSEQFQPPASRALAAIVQMLSEEPRTRHARVSWPGVEVRRYQDELHVMPTLGKIDAALDLAWDLAAPIDLPGLGLRLSAQPAIGQGLSRARLDQVPLRLRLRRGGEVCRLPGHSHRQTLKKLLQGHAIAPWLRTRLPLLYAGEELAAVADLWVCEPYAAHGYEPGMRLVVQKI